MKADLSPNEIAILANYRFVVSEPEKDVQINFSPFFNESTMSSCLKRFKDELGAPDLKTAASLFMKRHAFLAALYLYSMSAFNKKLDVSPENIILEDAIHDGLWLPGFYLKNKTTDVCPTRDRAEWRAEAVRHLFVDNLFPVMDAISKSANISKLILWENVAVYIFWLYEKILSEVADPEVKLRAAEDLSFLVEHAPGKLFGRYSKNPITRFYSETVYQEGTDSYIRIRKTCCYSYMLKEKGSYCKTCPHTCGMKIGSVKMDKNFTEQINGLLEKYTELLVGEGSAENVEKVKTWILYSHIAKSMPPLAKHWNAEYPDAKDQIKNVIAEVKEMNEKNRQK
ncbi:hypothetical protein JCM21738_4212 [Mesobacillus boroniphilus JCM 21738]|uniref:Aerobactin siderophore biosynthesis IucA/IucC-like C-terminal domain-containing protein n=2 Tax=Mesobacillus boroniphilus TaxID=308892 RepID=W4RUB7_9BACI|nr:hypothetical protein JCM21738_4212 [Mesobacillus boroniphilus JCM 21738]